MFYKKILLSFLFLFKPEFAHKCTLLFLKTTCKIPYVSYYIKKYFCAVDKDLECLVFGLKFKSPVGVAAGFDKNAQCYNELENFGFGFVEIGTITNKPQKGNPKKRLFRLKQDNAIINRMGFNNNGVDKICKNLKKKRNILIGGNIGKNKLTTNDNAYKDYINVFSKLFNYVDYFVINVSSPNTENLRLLQQKDLLMDLLTKLQQNNLSYQNPKPILVKISPDLSNDELLDIVEIVKKTKIAGIIATNTTTNRYNLKSENKFQQGGLSGAPLYEKSLRTVKFLSEKSNKEFSIIAVGGISSAKQAIEMLNAGASLVQIYTGLIYQGPQLVKEINQAYLKNKKETL